jgi:hypothetical protein
MLLRKKQALVKAFIYYGHKICMKLQNLKGVGCAINDLSE